MLHFVTVIVEMPKRSEKTLRKVEVCRKMRKARNLKKHAIPTSSTQPLASSTTASIQQDQEGDNIIRGASAASVITATQHNYNVTTSEIRKKIFSVQQQESTSRYVLISQARIQEAFSKLRCGECCGEITVATETNGFEVAVKIVCRDCEEDLSPEKAKTKHSSLNKRGMVTEANVIMVYQSLVNNYGLAGFNKTAAALGLKTWPSRKYMMYSTYLYHEMNQHCSKLMDEGYECIVEYYRSIGIRPDSDGILNIDVSFDGTWLEQGRKSRIGVGCVSEINTGTIIDFEVLSKFCQVCTLRKKRFESRSDFDTWKREEHESKCQNNYDGDPGRVEATTAVRMWNRSEVNKKLRYTVLVHAGESKAYIAVSKLKNNKGPYAVPVTKEEHVNNLCKRLETRLKMFKPHQQVDVSETEQIETNQLTEKMIGKLALYFGNAIQDTATTNVKTIRNAAMATYFHAISTDDRPLHDLCPVGEDSWCDVNGAKEEGMPGMSTGIRNGENVDINIPENLQLDTRRIYEDLTKTEILEKCLTVKGRALILSERFHSKIWNKISETKNYGYDRTKFITQCTILEHNFGYDASYLLAALGFAPSKEYAAGFTPQDDDDGQRPTPSRLGHLRKKRNLDTSS